jgi:Xaa-Pro aminopeptidase
MNRDRAEAVMDRLGVSALLLAEPMNVYHATGFWPQTVAMGQAGISFAIVPRDPASPVWLVTSQFVHYIYDLDHVPADYPLQILLYTAPDGVEGNAAPPFFFGEAKGGTPDPFDRYPRSSSASLLAARPALADSKRALLAALESARADGLLATDSAIPQQFFGDRFAYRPADPLLRWTRMVKTPAEIVLMRHAARNNAEAARVAISAMEVGGTYEALRRGFFAETGRRGGIPLFMSTDSAPVRQRDGVIRAGRSFAIDAVSHYAGYHGDYGRTVFVGPPGAPVLHALDAAVTANDAIASALRPGLRYSDVMRIGRDAVAKVGYAVSVACSAHSVGLLHTDEAFKDDALNFSKADHLIEQDMVLSVDCPTLQVDASGNVHLEDLWLITKDGCEPLNDRDEPFIQI